MVRLSHEAHLAVKELLAEECHAQHGPLGRGVGLGHPLEDLLERYTVPLQRVLVRVRARVRVRVRVRVRDP